MSDMLTAPWDARPVGELRSRSWRGLASGQAVEDDFRLQWRDRAGFSPASAAMRESSYGRLLILVNDLLRLSGFSISHSCRTGRFSPEKVLLCDKNATIAYLGTRWPRPNAFCSTGANERGIDDLRRKVLPARPMPENKLQNFREKMGLFQILSGLGQGMGIDRGEVESPAEEDRGLHRLEASG
jgi:hypothetical protein